jgi:hypothetical protein
MEFNSPFFGILSKILLCSLFYFCVKLIPATYTISRVIKKME